MKYKFGDKVICGSSIHLVIHQWSEDETVDIVGEDGEVFTVFSKSLSRPALETYHLPRPLKEWEPGCWRIVQTSAPAYSLDELYFARQEHAEAWLEALRGN